MINSLVMGFGILGRRLEILAIPVVLSIVALLLPPLDLSFLTRQLAASLEEAQTLSQGPTADGARPELQPGLEALGMEDLFGADSPWAIFEEFPLEIVLVNRFFFRVPGYVSLMPMAEIDSPWSSPTFGSTGDVLALLGGALACGVLIGAFYLYQLGRQVTACFPPTTQPPPETEQEPDVDAAAPEVVGFWFRAGQMFLYFAFLLAAWMVSSLLFALFLVIVTLIAPPAAPVLLSLTLPLLFVGYVLFIYYQTYVAAGVMMDGLTAWHAFRNSLQMVRRDFFRTLLFLFLAGFILLGIELLLESLIGLTQNHVVSFLVAALIFAYVGTGVAAAFLVFYRTRRLAQQGVDITQFFATQEK